MSKEAAIDSILDRIRERSAAFPADRLPHHFSFDIRTDPDRPVEIVVLGLNPGESTELAPPGVRHERVLEESSRFNFQETKTPDGSSKRWKTRLGRLLGGRSVSFSNVFFWSSRDAGRSFKDRFETSLLKHPWLDFCTALNVELIEVHRPKLVMLMGLGHVHRLASKYGLATGEPVSNERGRLVVPLSGRPEQWLAVKHPTGARLSDAELGVIRDHVDRCLARRQG